MGNGITATVQGDGHEYDLAPVYFIGLLNTGIPKSDRSDGTKVEGKAEGLAEGKTDVARAMKAKGLETSLISELTGLSVEEIQRL